MECGRGGGTAGRSGRTVRDMAEKLRECGAEDRARTRWPQPRRNALA